MKSLVVAGTRSGCGKTSVAVGLMAALARRGLRIAPFKCGPDFIDPSHHEHACGQPSHNLDGWMCGRLGVEDIFARHAQGADVAVIEGVMGLFDGFSGSSESGSTAEIAKWLRAPVLLVADVSSMARSVAAMVGGYIDFDPEVAFAGVLLNRVGSAAHGEIASEALAAAGLNLIGMLPRAEEIGLPARHLGLSMGQETGEDMYARLADWVEAGIDLDALLSGLPEMVVQPVNENRTWSADDEHIPGPLFFADDSGEKPRADEEPDTPGAASAAPLSRRPKAHVARIAVAQDQAFCFYYRENLRLLEDAGAELVFFSPVSDKKLPEGADGLYLGGGYPELSAFDLSNNAGLRREIKRFAEDGRPVYAECGGFMYLMESIKDARGSTCMMSGVFPLSARMAERFAALGYRQVTTTRDCILGPAGTLARGHEFHYSVLPDEAYKLAGLYAVQDRKGPREKPEGFAAHNVVASYIPLHFCSNPALARHLVEACAS